MHPLRNSPHLNLNQLIFIDKQQFIRYSVIRSGTGLQAVLPFMPESARTRQCNRPTTSGKDGGAGKGRPGEQNEFQALLSAVHPLA